MSKRSIDDVLEREFNKAIPLGRNLQLFEDELRCEICCEFYNIPVSLNCGHVFCSLCIRNHLDTAINTSSLCRSCPSCKVSAESSQLKAVRVVSSLVSSWLNIRSSLIDMMDNFSLKLNDNSHKISSSSSISGAFGAKAQNRTAVKRVAHMHFHGVPKAKIKKALEKLCENSAVKLRFDGDKETLEKRYREFIHMNNCQLNSDKPLSLEEVILEVNRRESVRDKEAIKSSFMANKLDNLKHGEVF
jgi:hypothetical protein